MQRLVARKDIQNDVHFNDMVNTPIRAERRMRSKKKKK